MNLRFLGLIVLMMAPYIDKNPATKPNERKFAICLFTALRTQSLLAWAATVIAAIQPIQTTLFWGRREPTIQFLLTMALTLYFHRGVKLRIPFVIVAFSGTRVGTGFLSSEGEQASKESLALLSGHGVEGRRLPSPRSFPTLFRPWLQKGNHQRAVQQFIHRTASVF